jgi:hypothetical protein
MDGEVGSVAIFADHKVAPAFAVKLCKVGEVLLHSTALDPKLPLIGKLGHGQTTTERIKHVCKVLRIVLGSRIRLFSLDKVNKISQNTPRSTTLPLLIPDPCLSS